MREEIICPHCEESVFPDPPKGPLWERIYSLVDSATDPRTLGSIVASLNAQDPTTIRSILRSMVLSRVIVAERRGPAIVYDSDDSGETLMRLEQEGPATKPELLNELGGPDALAADRLEALLKRGLLRADEDGRYSAVPVALLE